jgi:hypothetical protein
MADEIVFNKELKKPKIFPFKKRKKNPHPPF